MTTWSSWMSVGTLSSLVSPTMIEPVEGSGLPQPAMTQRSARTSEARRNVMKRGKVVMAARGGEEGFESSPPALAGPFDEPY
jgi:hypothetical protein